MVERNVAKKRKRTQINSHQRSIPDSWWQREPRESLPRMTWAISVMSVWLLLSGCGRKTDSIAQPPPVTVMRPVMQDITLYEYFTGQVEAIDSVDIRSRVSGYLDQIRFESGSEVRKDDVLFIIDQRPFQAKVDQQSANLEQAKAQQKLAHIQYKRDIGLQKTDPGAIAQVAIDRSVANVGVQDANVLQSQAQLEEAQLDLDYCTISSPIAGQVSRNYVSVGNLITGGTAQATLLTTVVSVDPIYAYFYVDEQTIDRVQKSIRDGERPPVNSKKIPVELGLNIDGDKYPHAGLVDFSDNQFSTDTGTLQVRGLFNNPKPETGSRVLVPGQFVNLRVPVSQGPQLLINSEAIGQDIVGTYVVVVDENEIANYRYIEIGPEVGRMTVIEKGLSTADRVVISGQHNAPPGAKVSPREKTAESMQPPTPPAKTSDTGGQGD
ncbi:MAG: efflux RND transporter periplasmic adaptor subunit [Planctomycetota bacterium]|nr:efflux RND transporter periplasmic adaptor subunit [Planctomycetota bacterium]